MSMRGHWRAAILVMACACTGAGSPTASTSPVETEPIPADAFVRSCDSSVFGDLGKGWVADSVVAGPVVFVGLRGYATMSEQEIRAGRNGRIVPMKVLLVAQGTEPVAVTIGGGGVGSAALWYDPEAWSTRRPTLEDGDLEVVFEPCGGGPQFTQFNGGFLLSGPSCVPVVVTTSDGEVSQATLSFGAGRCS
jgi:hypothetical protein